MKGQHINIIPAFLSAIIICIVFSCANDHAFDKVKLQTADSVDAKKTKSVSRKPAATYQDTLMINVSSAVFYSPDSIQLQKIKQFTDSVVYIGSMHEYFYMMRNARAVIKKEWPGLKIIEAKNYRYLLFIKKDGSKQCIDLDNYENSHGLFVFDRKKSPLLVDMMNVDTQVSFYLNP
jgi:hypothetical protein